jgi:hypothetical protein
VQALDPGADVGEAALLAALDAVDLVDQPYGRLTSRCGSAPRFPTGVFRSAAIRSCHGRWTGIRRASFWNASPRECAVRRAGAGRAAA